MLREGGVEVKVQHMGRADSIWGNIHLKMLIKKFHQTKLLQ